MFTSLFSKYLCVKPSRNFAAKNLYYINAYFSFLSSLVRISLRQLFFSQSEITCLTTGIFRSKLDCYIPVIYPLVFPIFCNVETLNCLHGKV